MIYPFVPLSSPLLIPCSFFSAPLQIVSPKRGTLLVSSVTEPLTCWPKSHGYLGPWMWGPPKERGPKKESVLWTKSNSHHPRHHGMMVPLQIPIRHRFQAWFQSCAGLRPSTVGSTTHHFLRVMGFVHLASAFGRSARLCATQPCTTSPLGRHVHASEA